jgi:hypothetical protein
MKVKIFLLLIVTLYRLNAQVFDFSTKWYYCRQDWPSLPGECKVIEFKNSRINKDTQVYDVNDWFASDNQIKQIGNKVWLNNDLIYNFDLKVGEVLDLKFSNTIQRFKVDSIGLIFFYGKNRMIQYLSGIDNFQKIACIHGVGMTFNYSVKEDFGIVYLNLQLLYFMSIADPAFILSIYEKNGNKQVLNLIGSCKHCEDLVSAPIKTFDKVTLFPNPSQSSIMIDGLEIGNEVKIYRNDGTLITTFISSAEMNDVDLSTYNTGIYQVLVFSKNKLQKTIRFIKS